MAHENLANLGLPSSICPLTLTSTEICHFRPPFWFWAQEERSVNLSLKLLFIVLQAVYCLFGWIKESVGNPEVFRNCGKCRQTTCEETVNVCLTVKVNVNISYVNVNYINVSYMNVSLTVNANVNVSYINVSYNKVSYMNVSVTVKFKVSYINFSYRNVSYINISLSVNVTLATSTLATIRLATRTLA